MKTRTTNPTLELPVESRTLVDVAVLETLFDLAPDVAFFVKDIEGRYRAVNMSLVERHGLTEKAQVIGKRPRDICPGDFGGLPSEQDAEVLRTGRPILDHLEQHWYTPHKPGWCLTTKLPLRNAAGKIIGLIGMSRDVRAPIESKDIPSGFAAALNHFEANLAEEITPSSLARRARLPSPRFARLMKRYFGLTPSQYITKARLAAASRLLRESDKTISEIGIACGFYDHSSFTRAFRAAVGVTPTQYRAVNH